jgi:hypothetical protein
MTIGSPQKIDNLAAEQERLLSEISPFQLEEASRGYPHELGPFVNIHKPIPFGPIEYPWLENSLAKRVVDLAAIRFHGKDAFLSEYYGSIPGIEILSRTDLKKTCDWYVFKDEKWYQSLQEKAPRTLFSSSTIRFFKKIGYKEVAQPEVGDLIAYIWQDRILHPRQVSHYGRVVAIEDGEPIVESKPVYSYAYRHHRDLIPAMWGNAYTYLRKTAKRLG